MMATEKTEKNHKIPISAGNGGMQHSTAMANARVRELANSASASYIVQSASLSTNARAS